MYDDNNLTAGVIATKVNGVPSTYIQGENIYIGNEKSTTVIAGKLNATEFTANNIQAKIATLTHLSVAALQATGGISSGGLISTSGNISASGTVSAGGHNLNVYDAGKSGDTLTIYRITGGNVSFEKPAEVKVQSTRYASYTTNGRKTISPSSGWDAMAECVVTISVPTSGGGGCFCAGSLIRMADGSEMPIEKLTLGSTPVAYDSEQHAFAETTVVGIKLFKHRDDVYDIRLDNGKDIVLTDSHPLLTENGWKAIDPDKVIKENHHNDITVGRLTTNDRLFGVDGFVGIVNIKYREDLTDCTVYNIDVEEIDTYIVNGIIAHNADDK